MKRVPLAVEALETRDLMAASVALLGGNLSILADGQGDYLVAQNVTKNGVAMIEILEPTGPVGQGTNLVWDFVAANVTSLTFVGGAGPFGDTFYNNTALASLQIAGPNSGQNLLVGGTASDTLVGSSNPSGESNLQDNAGNNVLIAGAGFSNLFAGSGNDTEILGPGRHQLYDILGTNNIISVGGTGYLLVNAASTVQAAAGDAVVTFFQGTFANQTSPFFQQKDVNGNNIFYILPQSTTNQIIVNVSYTDATFQNIRVSYQDGSQNQSIVVAASSVQWLAYFGGLRGAAATPVTSSYLVNATQTNAVLYGGKGNDYIVSYGRINVLKGHSGNDFVGGFGAYNDLSAGPGTSQSIFLGSSTGENIFRPNRATISDQIGQGFHSGDTIVGPVRAINGPALGDADTLLDNTDYLFLYYAEIQSRKQGPFGF